LLLVIAFGLAASLRPTLCLLGIPMLTWVFWGRPWRDWAIALPTGIVAVLLWYGPLIAASGGWDLLQRSQDALVVNYFLENFSILGRRSDQVFILVNLNIALWGAGLALLIWPAWRRVQQGDVRWARAAAAVIGFHLAFYLLIYTAETGYFAGIAAITLLAPATWFQQTWGLRTAVLSAALVAVLGAGFVLFGPASSPFVGIDSENFVRQPTLASVRQWDQLNRFYRDAVCPYAKDGGALVLTDSSHGALIRGASVSCGLAITQWRGPGELNPDADTILLHDGPRIYSVPTGVPLEAGPPITFDLPGPRTRVLVSPAASDRLMKAIRKQESCPPIAGLPGLPGPEFPEGPVVWETRCLPVPLLGANRIRVQPAAESRP
ncbi:MAG: hypothetical protein VX498_10415, partial [Myxococcota bacterium]|nr:hypothetical protein [Myxococcota bacterium]